VGATSPTATDANIRAAVRPLDTQLIGGHPILDLTNTVSWRRDPHRRQERLPTFVALVAWLRRVKLLDVPTATMLREWAELDETDTTRTLDRICAFREDIYALLVRITSTQLCDSRALGSLQRQFAEALSRATPTRTFPLRWNIEVHEPDDLLWLLALSALELLQSPQIAYARQCADEGCGWLFLDTSRNHSRRWCSSADCGNRHRVKRHYARRRAARAVGRTT
jgi:predicted RNA-binding Zn ribbon-like protein